MTLQLREIMRLTVDSLPGDEHLLLCEYLPPLCCVEVS